MIFPDPSKWEDTMLSKIIAAALGLAAVGLFVWKFKETPLCRP
jgi:hypothetical protein